MRLERHDFSFTLELLSPLHIGDGETSLLGELRAGPAGENPEVGTIVRDCDGRPWIPPTSLKGALRDLVDNEQARNLVFGREPTTETDTGASGHLILWGGTLKTKVSDCALPYWNADQQSFILTRVRIDRATGAAMEGKLFLAEYVPAGVRFRVEGCWQGSAADFEAHVLPILSRMAGEHGFALGAGSGAAFGRVQLVDTTVELKGQKLELDNGGPTIKPSKTSVGIKPESQPTQQLVLHCPGPVLVVDPASPFKERENQLVAMMHDTSMPEILGTSVLGVMRTRATWLQQTRMGEPADDPDALWSNDMALSPAQELFGVAGFSGRLKLEAIHCEVREPQLKERDASYPGVKLDEVTQGVIDQALFELIAPADIRLRLSFPSDGTGRWSSKARELWWLLCQDIAKNGLEIGHSKATGFGWFDLV